MRDINLILSDFRQSSIAIAKEAPMRAEVMNAQEYMVLERIIEDAQKKQKLMLDTLPDTREEYEMDKKELIDYMQENKEFTIAEFKAKTRVTREVNVYETLQGLGGDIDALMIVSSIKIGALEKFIKENPGYRKDLRGCIVEKDVTVTDIGLI